MAETTRLTLLLPDGSGSLLLPDGSGALIIWETVVVPASLTWNVYGKMQVGLVHGELEDA